MSQRQQAELTDRIESLMVQGRTAEQARAVAMREVLHSQREVL